MDFPDYLGSSCYTVSLDFVDNESVEKFLSFPQDYFLDFSKKIRSSEVQKFFSWLKGQHFLKGVNYSELLRVLEGVDYFRGSLNPSFLFTKVRLVKSYIGDVFIIGLNSNFCVVTLVD